MRLLRSIPLFAVLIVACGGDDDGGTQPTVATLDRITVTSSAVSVQAGQRVTISPSGVDSKSAQLSGVTFAYSSGSPNVAVVSSAGVVTGLAAGTSTVTVTGTLAGVSKTTTVTVTVTGTLATTATVVASATGIDFAPQVVAIARGGTVSWTFPGIAHNVTFAATAGAPANIGNTSNSGTPIPRTFNTAGTFDYNCTLHAGMTGTVIVP